MQVQPYKAPSPDHRGEEVQVRMTTPRSWLGSKVSESPSKPSDPRLDYRKRLCVSFRGPGHHILPPESSLVAPDFFPLSPNRLLFLQLNSRRSSWLVFGAILHVTYVSLNGEITLTSALHSHVTHRELSSKGETADGSFPFYFSVWGTCSWNAATVTHTIYILQDYSLSA